MKLTNEQIKTMLDYGARNGKDSDFGIFYDYLNSNNGKITSLGVNIRVPNGSSSIEFEGDLKQILKVIKATKEQLDDLSFALRWLMEETKEMKNVDETEFLKGKGPQSIYFKSGAFNVTKGE